MFSSPLLSLPRPSCICAQEGVDRSEITLPGVQSGLIAAVCAAAAARSAPCILLLMTGSSLDVSAELANPNVTAILFTGYAGPWQGNATARLVFGDTQPAGRLSATWYLANYTASVSPMEVHMRPGPSVLPPFTNPGHTFR
jgi:xylan 1,4-beta-xylosidase